jgi:hypothetical protein
MIFAGHLLDLISEYQASWSGRCRGRARTAYSKGPEGIALRADFCRWLARKMKKEGEMFLQKEIESDHLLIYIFRKDEKEMSAVRAVAEAILKFGDDPEGVPSSAINFAIAGHPHSGGQRAREIFAAYRRQWRGVQDVKALFREHIFKGNRYYFSPVFLQWLRASLPEIESVVYPVQSRLKREYVEK